MNEQTQQPTPKPCPECGGERIHTKYTKQYPAVEIKLTTLLGLLKPSSTINALTCLTCGYTMLYAAQPDKLRPYNYKK